MSLFKVINARINKDIQKVLFYNALRIEKQKDNIYPLNLGFLTLLSKDYLRGYPASFYLLFDKMPDISLSLRELYTMDKKISGPIIYKCIQDKNDQVTCDNNLTRAYALYSRVKHYTNDTKIMRANLRLWGDTYYVQDDEYVYDPMLLYKYPINSFYNIYNPKKVHNITNHISVKLLEQELTSNIEQAKEDYFNYAESDVLDRLYNEAHSKKDSKNTIDLLRIAQIDDFFKTMNYEYESGFLQYIIK